MSACFQKPGPAPAQLSRLALGAAIFLLSAFGRLRLEDLRDLARDDAGQPGEAGALDGEVGADEAGAKDDEDARE